MEQKTPVNFDAAIHSADYTREYESRQITAETMVFTGGHRTTSLNGPWHYAVDQYDTCIRQKWFEEKRLSDSGDTLPLDYSFEEWPLMELPCCWNLQKPEYLLYESPMVFTRTFDHTAVPEERVILRIGAANYLCRLFLNGIYLGTHRGGSTPFFADITELLKSENRLIISVDATRRHEQVPTENTDWFNYGGLYRDIQLIHVPNIFIKDFRIALVPDGTFHHIGAEVNLSEPVDAKARLRIPELNLERDIDIVDGTGSILFDAEPELWSPDLPRLYDVELTCYGGTTDTVTDRVGFREIRRDGRQILLNGTPIFLKGISCHEESVKNGKAPSQEERMETIRIAKEMGCNYMRLAHYPHHEEMSRLADEMGLMLWEEIPVYWAIRFDRQETYLDAENQLRELIRRDYNRASVILWSVGNENADTEERLSFMRRLTECARSEDATRLISAACLVDHVANRISDRLAEHLDVIGINEYYGWYDPDFRKLPLTMSNSDPDKPVIITEFGADALQGCHGGQGDKGTEECQEDVYKKQVDTLRRIPYIRGMSPWILFDFRCPRRTSHLQNYYNRKGLLNEDRTYRKPAYFVMKDFYGKM
ncbi:MAG: glycoside hydrolase family 2 [Eubacterium sp.]|nr:glycoside hydrolase family 2 [Eubacterium sp.]